MIRPRTQSTLDDWHSFDGRVRAIPIASTNSAFLVQNRSWAASVQDSSRLFSSCGQVRAPAPSPAAGVAVCTGTTFVYVCILIFRGVHARLRIPYPDRHLFVRGVAQRTTLNFLPMCVLTGGRGVARSLVLIAEADETIGLHPFAHAGRYHWVRNRAYHRAQ